MSEIKNHVGVPIHDAIMDIYEQIQLLHKRIDDLKEEFSMLRAGKVEEGVQTTAMRATMPLGWRLQKML